MNLRSSLMVSLLMLLPLIWQERLFPQAMEIEGQASGWTTVMTEDPCFTQFGLRYIPNLHISKRLSGVYFIDAALAANMRGTGLVYDLHDIDTEGRTEPYRLWLRLSGKQFEARLGLQKINFGSATLLRPLMWFDRLDPRDPLQLTDGVYGVLLRYYFLNNANIWLWGLYGNDETKGWEVLPPDEETPEYGGRVQFPLANGEIAFTYHHRTIDLIKGLEALLSIIDLPVIPGLGPTPIVINPTAPEKRFGCDAKLDIEIGLWFEAALIHQDIDFFSMPEYKRFINVGGDYTFGLENGLNVLAEHLITEISQEAFGSGERFQLSALSVNYPLGLIDTVTGILYYDWENEGWYRFLNYQRTYDAWRFHLIGFWNPEQYQLYQGQSDGNTFTGKGIQAMVTFNH